MLQVRLLRLIWRIMGMGDGEMKTKRRMAMRNVCANNVGDFMFAFMFDTFFTTCISLKVNTMNMMLASIVKNGEYLENMID